MYHQESKLESMSKSLADRLVMPMKVVYFLCLVAIGILLLTQDEPLHGIMYWFGMDILGLIFFFVFLHVYALVAIVMACDAVAISSAAKGMVFFLGAAIISYMNEHDLKLIGSDENDPTVLEGKIDRRRPWYYVFVLFSFASFLFAGVAEPSIYGRSGFLVFLLLPLMALFQGPPLFIQR